MTATPSETHEAALSDERLHTFANSLGSGEWTSALLKAYNPTGAVAVTYEQAKAALVADLLARRTQPSSGEVVAWRYRDSFTPDGEWSITFDPVEAKAITDAAKEDDGYACDALVLATPPDQSRVERLEATHRHVKRGTEYVLIGYGRMQAENWADAKAIADALLGLGDPPHSIDMREVAIYRSVDDGSLWVRPREEFEDGRFQALHGVRT